MVVTHSRSTQKKWQTENFYRFQKIKCNHEEGSIPISICYRLKGFYMEGDAIWSEK